MSPRAVTRTNPGSRRPRGVCTVPMKMPEPLLFRLSIYRCRFQDEPLVWAHPRDDESPVQPPGGLSPLSSSASQPEICHRASSTPHPRPHHASFSFLSGWDLHFPYPQGWCCNECQAPHPTVGEACPCSRDSVAKSGPRALDCP